MAAVGSLILVIRCFLSAWWSNSEGFVPGEAPNLSSVRSGNLPFPVEWVVCMDTPALHKRRARGLPYGVGRFSIGETRTHPP